MTIIDDLVERIRELSSAQRRQLLRRLRINGLIDFEEAITDEDPLNTATALGLSYSDQPAVEEYEADLAGESILETVAEEQIIEPLPPTDFGEHEPVEQAIDTLEQPQSILPEPVHIDLTQGNHLAPSSGKVVVGVPTSPQEHEPDPEDPHGMAPVPGQGPGRPIKLIFDGGSKGNPGYGYGSYSLEWPGMEPQVVRLQHGNNITNNEAEYDTLVKALEAVLKRLDGMGADPSTAEIDIRGDSLLVINQVLGEWKCKHDRLKRRRDKIKIMLDQFEYWELRHHDRENSVRILGH